jgi:carbon monoxide dehydrogenase subunit G
MKVQRSFTVPGSPRDVLDALTDVERVAECLPGGLVDGRSRGGRFGGSFALQLGSSTAPYTAIVAASERDAAGGRAVVTVSGHDDQGDGTAEVTARIAVSEIGDSTAVALDLDIELGGRLAGDPEIEATVETYARTSIAALRSGLVAPAGEPRGAEPPSPAEPAEPRAAEPPAAAEPRVAEPPAAERPAAEEPPPAEPRAAEPPAPPAELRVAEPPEAQRPPATEPPPSEPRAAEPPAEPRAAEPPADPPAAEPPSPQPQPAERTGSIPPPGYQPRGGGRAPAADGGKSASAKGVGLLERLRGLLHRGR